MSEEKEEQQLISLQELTKITDTVKKQQNRKRVEEDVEKWKDFVTTFNKKSKEAAEKGESAVTFSLSIAEKKWNLDEVERVTRELGYQTTKTYPDYDYYCDGFQIAWK